MARVRRPNALIVEGDRGQSDLAALVLGEFDLDVTQVRTAGEAIEHLCEGASEVSVVLIDVHLDNGMDGLSLAHRVSVLWPNLSMLVTCGDAAAGEAVLPPRTTFIPKPWRPLDIVAAAARAVSTDHSVHAVRY
jgi:DNA-binding NtrC family response regulator